MPRATKTNWAAIDWRQPNMAIAAATGHSADYIKRRRARHAPGTVGQYHSPARPSSLAALAIGRTPEVIARAKEGAARAAREHPRRRKGPDQAAAREWALRAPDGTVWRGRNLYEFVRTHPDLFEPEDRVWKRVGGTGNEWCRATAGLGKLRHQRRGWKGWTLAG
ncbi:MAG: hypothetical protein JWM59_3957 [Verrucomicrobiales bacterium]|nr:hypothetical protein [Verrucomicrobiales bacterium]